MSSNPRRGKAPYTVQDWNNVSSVLSDFEWAAYEYEDEFLAEFTSGGEALMDIKWGSDGCKFVFLAPGGQSVADSIGIPQWLNFYLGQHPHQP